MRIVTGEAGHAARVHEALDEVIALHTVFVCAGVGEEVEILRPELGLFQVPEVCEAIARQVADGPVWIFAVDGE